MLEPRELLDRGRRILDPALAELGLAFNVLSEGKGSGGRFVAARYGNYARGMEIHVRGGLGLVTYILEGAELSHLDLAACLGIERDALAYPGFGDDPVDAFRHLAADVTGPLSSFFDGSIDEEFKRCAESVAQDPDTFKPGLP